MIKQTTTVQTAPIFLEEGIYPRKSIDHKRTGVGADNIRVGFNFEPVEVMPAGYGAHTFRKTWGYHQRVNHGVGFEILCKRYNHSSPVVTMRYLGIESKEVTDMLMNAIG